MRRSHRLSDDPNEMSFALHCYEFHGAGVYKGCEERRGNALRNTGIKTNAGIKSNSGMLGCWDKVEFWNSGMLAYWDAGIKTNAGIKEILGMSDG